MVSSALVMQLKSPPIIPASLQFTSNPGKVSEQKVSLPDLERASVPKYQARNIKVYSTKICLQLNIFGIKFTSDNTSCTIFVESIVSDYMIIRGDKTAL